MDRWLFTARRQSQADTLRERETARLTIDPRSYVYNVAYRDADGLYEALKSALENPIERHIIPEVTDAANDERVRRLFARDLRAEAAEIYAADAATEVVMEELIDA